MESATSDFTISFSENQSDRIYTMQSADEKDIVVENQILIAENKQLKLELQTKISDFDKLQKENEMCRSELKKYRLDKQKNLEACIFDDCEATLSMDILKQLECLENSRRNDSTFVLTIMRQLYSNKVEELKSKTACGRGNSNGIISQKNRNMIENHFAERLTKANLAEQEWSERYFRLNELINSAINNLLRQKVSKGFVTSPVDSFIG